MLEGEFTRLAVWVGGVTIGYIILGYLTVFAWESVTLYPVPAEDVRAVRVLWWVFASLALALALMHLMDVILHQLVPISADRLLKLRHLWIDTNANPEELNS